MKRFIGLFAFLFVVALISGCDSAKDEDPTVTGVWSGTTSVLGVSITITMNLLEDNQIVPPRVHKTVNNGLFTPLEAYFLNVGKDIGKDFSAPNGSLDWRSFEL